MQNRDRNFNGNNESNSEGNNESNNESNNDRNSCKGNDRNNGQNNDRNSNWNNSIDCSGDGVRDGVRTKYSNANRDSGHADDTATVRICHHDGERLVIDCRRNETLMEAMARNGIYYSAVCGGRGKCGKCRIQVLEGDLDITASDRDCISKEQLDQGFRLACKAVARKDCTILLTEGNESDFLIIEDDDLADRKKEERDTEASYGIGIDIGTTTIAIALIGMESKRMINTHTRINRQRAFGADVISRIQASNDGEGEFLRGSILADLSEGIRNVIEEADIARDRVVRIVIAGNTTMIHLLMGYSCESLGVYPFTPVTLDTIEATFLELFGTDYLHSAVIILPGISTYVGADITAGLFLCDYDRSESYNLLVDLGTNGEMAIGNKERILVCSTAAGPAFEGGNISCGIGSVKGAISNIEIESGRVEYTTIGSQPPVGICGTGVIEIASELVKEGLVDETGLLHEDYFEKGFPIACTEDGNPILFTQKDVREIQLAKSAVRAGVETLLLRANLSYDQIHTVYLAGGFGFKVNIEKAIRIGLLPREFDGKIKAIGNSSLKGAVKYLTEPEAAVRIDRIILASSEIQLSNDKDFNEFYMDNMFYE